jgi:hypothetical protein
MQSVAVGENFTSQNIKAVTINHIQHEEEEDDNNNNNNNHLAVKDLGHLLTRSGLTSRRLFNGLPWFLLPFWV